TTLEDHVARHIRHAAWERDEMSMVVPDELRRVAQQAIAA
ncbi:MAG TPA: MarR family transcriptional regulator, partial [Cupriavidus sp.]|nr:MarR family transcriptional regulator [Cupriavidus sp.]